MKDNATDIGEGEYVVVLVDREQWEESLNKGIAMLHLSCESVQKIDNCSINYCLCQSRRCADLV